MPRVLLIEDDPSVREGVELGLRRRGHEVRTAATGEAGLAALAEFRPDLLLLDLMLPGMNGVQVCRQVRENSQLPIIMLTARGDDFDVVIGLEAGADDYIVKPARTEVIEARIRAVLRRIDDPGNGPPGRRVPRRTRHRPGRAHRHQVRATARARPLRDASPAASTAAPEQVFSRQQLLEHVWEHSYHGDARLVDACVRRLRNKIEDGAGSPRYIQTLRGFGYRFGPL